MKKSVFLRIKSQKNKNMDLIQKKDVSLQSQPSLIKTKNYEENPNSIRHRLCQYPLQLQ